MEALELLEIISCGETSRVQFKESINSNDMLMHEMAAMSNCKGGRILLGVKDNGEIAGLSPEAIADLSSRAANIACNNIRPLVYIYTEVVTLDNKRILIIEINEGSDKPYYDKDGIIWTKTGADKRKVTDNNELARLLALGGNLTADEMSVRKTNIEDIDFRKVFVYCRKKDPDFSEEGIEINKLLTNLNLYNGENLTLAGMLIFGREPQRYKPVLSCIKAASYFGNDMEGTNYRSSRDLEGTLPELFKRGMDFLLSNLLFLQNNQNFNSQGELEVPDFVLEELLVNALMHRNYFKNASIKLFVFDNRIEIISPGQLPNGLTVENIKEGNAVPRNSIIVSICSRLLPYKGFGSGIARAVKALPTIEFVNDIVGEQFKAIIPRPALPS